MAPYGDHYSPWHCDEKQMHIYNTYLFFYLYLLVALAGIAEDSTVDILILWLYCKIMPTAIFLSSDDYPDCYDDYWLSHRRRLTYVSPVNRNVRPRARISKRDRIVLVKVSLVQLPLPHYPEYHRVQDADHDAEPQYYIDNLSTSFSLFSQLPLELRRKIIGLVTMFPRSVNLAGESFSRNGDEAKKAAADHLFAGIYDFPLVQRPAREALESLPAPFYVNREWNTEAGLVWQACNPMKLMRSVPSLYPVHHNKYKRPLWYNEFTDICYVDFKEGMQYGSTWCFGHLNSEYQHFLAGLKVLEIRNTEWTYLSNTFHLSPDVNRRAVGPLDVCINLEQLCIVRKRKRTTWSWADKMDIEQQCVQAFRRYFEEQREHKFRPRPWVILVNYEDATWVQDYYDDWSKGDSAYGWRAQNRFPDHAPDYDFYDLHESWKGFVCDE